MLWLAKAPALAGKGTLGCMQTLRTVGVTAFPPPHAHGSGWAPELITDCQDALCSAHFYCT